MTTKNRLMLDYAALPPAQQAAAYLAMRYYQHGRRWAALAAASLVGLVGAVLWRCPWAAGWPGLALLGLAVFLTWASMPLPQPMRLIVWIYLQLTRGSK